MSDDKETNVESDFLVDEDKADPNQQYIKPNYIETTLSKEKKMECREIVRVINEYGVSQRQKMFIVYLLSLELEDMRLVKGIAKLVGEVQNSIQDGKIIVEETPKKKILV